MIHSYPAVFQLGHAAIADIFKSVVQIEEKIDGSQFSFGIIDGELECRSKNKALVIDAPDAMFTRAVETARALAPILHPDWVYRGEYLSKPKHNALPYDRIPLMNIILFDIQAGDEEQVYLTYSEKVKEAERIGLECSPRIFVGMIESLEQFTAYLEIISVLGGTKIEGVVIKNYTLFTQEKKIALGKFVSEVYKEVQKGEWKKANPTQSDLVSVLLREYRTPARWAKAVQHLREAGTLTDNVKDIGLLINEIPADIAKECELEIRDKLWKFFWPHLKRAVTAGFPEWYKTELAKKAFEEKP